MRVESMLTRCPPENRVPVGKTTEWVATTLIHMLNRSSILHSLRYLTLELV